MRVLILAPNVFPGISGNAITVERWRRALTGKGIIVEVLNSQALTTSAFVACLERFDPNIIHVHHAFRAGSVLLHPAVAEKHARFSVVVSPGGTDINQDLDVPERRDAVVRVFRMAGAIVTQSSETAERLLRHIPDLDRRIVYVPKAVCWFGNESYDLRKIAGCNGRNMLFFLPAGIRPVKGNLECLMAMQKVHVIRPHIRFVAAGPAIDLEYADRFEREVKKLAAFAVWIAGIPPAAMRSAYDASDVVLNSSVSEGRSNSLLEAVASGRPILASNIPGNLWPVLGDNGDEHTGLLYELSDTDDFVANAVRLIDDESLRIGFGRATQSRISRLPDPEEEADGLIAAYEQALARRI
jgi:glycosyltransferase involved in cell wall biosynthesis